MSDDLGRRGFIQGLLATFGAAVLVGKVRPPEVPALVDLEAPEALEYYPGDTKLVTFIGASVKVSPLSFVKNFGFRYLAGNEKLGYGVRLYYDRSPLDMVFVQPLDGGLPALMTIQEGSNWVEARACDMRSGAFLKDVDFDILVVRYPLKIC